MHKLYLLGLSITLCCGAAAQQTNLPLNPAQTQAALSALYGSSAPVNVISINGLNCPVMASVQRGGSGAVVQTRQGAPGQPLSELKLHFGANRSGIAEATIALHGTDNRPRAELAYSFSPTGPELTEVVHLTGSTDHALTNASVNPAKVVNVRWVGISEIKFTDGTSWHSSASSYCHIQPNGFRLVDAAR